MYQIRESTIDHLLELMQIVHTKASGSVYWPILRNEPLVLQVQSALSELESEVRKSRESMLP
jgi:hypothetical protein